MMIRFFYEVKDRVAARPPAELLDSPEREQEVCRNATQTDFYESEPLKTPMLAGPRHHGPSWRSRLVGSRL